jgi:hypothetical protein
MKTDASAAQVEKSLIEEKFFSWAWRNHSDRKVKE